MPLAALPSAVQVRWPLLSSPEEYFDSFGSDNVPLVSMELLRLHCGYGPKECSVGGVIAVRSSPPLETRRQVTTEPPEHKHPFF